jgi:hypothetical protein
MSRPRPSFPCFSDGAVVDGEVADGAVVVDGAVVDGAVVVLSGVLSFIEG